MSKVSLIIGREYGERVKKKSFIFTTILMPVLMVLLMCVPVFIAMMGGTDTRTVTVVDPEGIIAPQLENSDNITYVIAPAATDTSDVAEGTTLLFIPRGLVQADAPLRIVSDEASSMMLENQIASQVEIGRASCRERVF